MSDKIISIIAKNCEVIREPADFERRVEPPWMLWTIYGQSALTAMNEARRPVELKWQELYRRAEEKQRANEMQRENLKRKAMEEGLARKKKKEDEARQKKRDKEKEKYAAYEQKKRNGERTGRPPRKPSPSPEPNS